MTCTRSGNAIVCSRGGSRRICDICDKGASGPKEQLRDGAEVFFVTSEYGKQLILNREPDTARGNVRIQPSHDGKEVGRVLAKGHAEQVRTTTMEALYLSHFASCPDAQRWHRKSA